MTRCFLVVVFALGCASAPAKASEQNYRLAYRAQFQQIMTARFGPELRTKGKTEKEIGAFIALMAEVAVDCQMQSLAAFPKRYREAMFVSAGQGRSMIEANAAVDAAVLADIDAGKMSADDALTMRRRAQQIFTACAKANGMDQMEP